MFNEKTLFDFCLQRIKLSNYFILDVIQIMFNIAINKNNVDFEKLLLKLQICFLKSTKTKFISIDFHFNENINEKT